MDARLHDFGGNTPIIRIDVHHSAAEVAHGDGYGGCIVFFAEHEHAAHPLILLKGNPSSGADNDIRTKSPDVCAPLREPADLVDCSRGNHGDACFVEDPVLQMCHLHRSSVAALNL